MFLHPRNISCIATWKAPCSWYRCEHGYSWACPMINPGPGPNVGPTPPVGWDDGGFDWRSKPYTPATNPLNQSQPLSRNELHDVHRIMGPSLGPDSKTFCGIEATRRLYAEGYGNAWETRPIRAASTSEVVTCLACLRASSK
jgi:hypothetical protein